MGTVCENVVTKSYPSIIEGEETRVSYFEPCSWPEDPLFHKKFEQITKKAQNEEFFSKKTLQRHRANDDYYLGDWDAAGYQKGKGILYRPGQLFYFGSFDSVPHGVGVLEDIRNEFVYEGEFNHGRIEGQGRLTKYNNLYSYEGNINSDAKPTNGTLTVDSNDYSLAYKVYLNNYPQDKAKIQFKDGRHYEGFINLKTFLPEGQGISKYPNGSIGGRLNGEFRGWKIYLEQQIRI